MITLIIGLVFDADHEIVIECDSWAVLEEVNRTTLTCFVKAEDGVNTIVGKFYNSAYFYLGDSYSHG